MPSFSRDSSDGHVEKLFGQLILGSMWSVEIRILATFRVEPGNAERRNWCVPTRSVGTRDSSA